MIFTQIHKNSGEQKSNMCALQVEVNLSNVQVIRYLLHIQHILLKNFCEAWTLPNVFINN